MISIYIFIMLVIIQRVIEVVIARRNEKWIKRQGGYEVGAKHYKLIVATHVMFFLALIIEVTVSWNVGTRWSMIPLVIFLLAQIGRTWTLSSLGRFWNTKIMVVPGAKVVAKGPYRFLRHPNYVIVIIEIAALPLIFHAYWTAMIFTLLNAFVLSIRIKEEERALEEATNYKDVFVKRKRFFSHSE